MVKLKKLAQPRLPLAHLQIQGHCAKCPDFTLCCMGNRGSIQVMVSSLPSLWPVLGPRCPQQQHFEVCKLVIL